LLHCLLGSLPVVELVPLSLQTGETTPRVGELLLKFVLTGE
jgi:hypothetical protein